MGDVDDDGVYDLIVGAGKDHAPEVVAYAGKAKDGKGRSRPSWRASRRSMPRRAAVSAWPPRRSTGRPPTTSSSARVPAFRAKSRSIASKLPSSPGAAPALFSTFNPYGDDRSGVSVAIGLRRFHDRPRQHRHRAGPGKPGGGEGVRLPADEADRPERSAPALGRTSASPATTSRPSPTPFMPFGMGYRGGVSLATGWLAGSLGGAERIVVSQLAGPGAVKVFSSGSRLEGGPAIYLASRRPYARRRPSPRSRASSRSTRLPA